MISRTKLNWLRIGSMCHFREHSNEFSGCGKSWNLSTNWKTGFIEDPRSRTIVSCLLVRLLSGWLVRLTNLYSCTYKKHAVVSPQHTLSTQIYSTLGMWWCHWLEAVLGYWSLQFCICITNAEVISETITLNCVRLPRFSFVLRLNNCSSRRMACRSISCLIIGL